VRMVVGEDEYAISLQLAYRHPAVGKECRHSIACDAGQRKMIR
jgi:hypothetical protein